MPGGFPSPSRSRRYKARKFLVYFQSFSNTYAPLDLLRRIYDEALAAVDDIVGLSIGTRPDCVDDGVLSLLGGYALDRLVWVEYGLQSAHDRTLVRINRGHDVACFEKAVAATRGRNIKICAHVILGLPGESREDMLATADFIAAMGLDGIKLHLLYVVQGTAMETLYKSGAYRCLEQREYAERVCDFIERLPDTTIIQRLTGDPHPLELVAPKWSRQKKETVDLIHTLFREKNTWQGKRYRGGFPA